MGRTERPFVTALRTNFREGRFVELRLLRLLGSLHSALCIVSILYGECPGPRLIHVLGSLCTTTICRSPSRGVNGLRSHPRGSQRAIYARSCIRTSENSSSTHFGE